MRWIEVLVTTLGEVLKFNRKEIYGWTLQEASDRIGTTKSYLWGLENGTHTDPGLSMVASIVDVYRISPEQMMRVAQRKFPKVAGIVPATMRGLTKNDA